MNSISDRDDQRQDESDAADAGIEELLREVGVRDEPAPEVMQAVRAAVHAEWRSVVAQRTQRSHIGFGIAAGFVAAVLGATLLFKYSSTPIAQPTLVAAIARVHSGTQAGVVQVSNTDGANWRDVAVGEQLFAGALLRTDSATRVALDVGNGLSLRVDAGSLFKLAAVDRVILERGRVYVDAPPLAHVPLSVQTKFGSIAHVGTQYQAQLIGDKLAVSVREGRIAYTHSQMQTQAAAGERIELDATGELARQPLPANDASWQWAVQVAPTFDIENQSLASFLEWVARETGRTITYATPAVRAQAERLILRGSVSNLSPDQALRAVLATTQFVHADSGTAIQVSL